MGEIKNRFSEAMQRMVQSKDMVVKCAKIFNTTSPDTIDGIITLINNELAMCNLVTGKDYIESVWGFYERRFNGVKILNKCEVRPATHGRGVFATRPIAPLEVITLYPGDYKTIRNSDSDSLQIVVRDGQAVPNEQEYTKYAFRGENISLIGDPDVTDNPTFLGHMCNDKAKSSCPEDESIYEAVSSKYCNAGVVPVGSHFYAIVASKPIKVGEEICFSYGLPYWRKYGRM